MHDLSVISQRERKCFSVQCQPGVGPMLFLSTMLCFHALLWGLHALNTGSMELNAHSSPQLPSLSKTSIWWLACVSTALISHDTQWGKNLPLLSIKIFKVMPLLHLFCTSAGDMESNKSSHIWVVNNAQQEPISKCQLCKSSAPPVAKPDIACWGEQTG